MARETDWEATDTEALIAGRCGSAVTAEDLLVCDAGQETSYDIQSATQGEVESNLHLYVQISCSGSRTSEKNSSQLYVQSFYSEDKYFLKVL